ncbi:MAG: HAD family hydrolase [Gemmatimonadota bacterium]
MRFDAVVFDLDGTLADTLSDIAAAMNYALARNGLHERDPDEYRSLVGEGVIRLVERAVPVDRPDLVEPVLTDLRAHYGEHMLDRTRAYPEVPELLDGLGDRGLPMAVLSNKPQAATTWMVERMFGEDRFATVRGGRDDMPLKPDPTALLEIVRALDIEPGRSAYVGDTRTDMETAVAAGVLPVGAAWGFRDRRELVEHGARAVIARPLELLQLLDGA